MKSSFLSVSWESIISPIVSIFIVPARTVFVPWQISVSRNMLGARGLVGTAWAGACLTVRSLPCCADCWGSVVVLPEGLWRLMDSALTNESKERRIEKRGVHQSRSQKVVDAEAKMTFNRWARHPRLIGRQHSWRVTRHVQLACKLCRHFVGYTWYFCNVDYLHEFHQLWVGTLLQVISDLPLSNWFQMHCWF